MLAVVFPEFLLHLVVKLGELNTKLTEGLFADRETVHISFSWIDEGKPFFETDVEASYDRWYSELASEKPFLINLVPNLVAASLHKENFTALIHFVGNNFKLFEFSYFELVHKLLHEIIINLVIKPKIRITFRPKFPEVEQSSELPEEISK